MTATEGKNEIIAIEPGELSVKAMEMKSKGLRLSQACAAWLRKDEKLELSYSFVDDDNYDMFNVSLDNDKRDTEIASISDIFPYAAFYENEMRELFGANIKVINLDFHNKLYRIEEETPFVPKKEGQN